LVKRTIYYYIIKQIISYYCLLLEDNASKLARLNHYCGIKINNEIINVIIDIGKLSELDTTIYLHIHFFNINANKFAILNHSWGIKINNTIINVFIDK
jgi:hypothetical protein